MALFNKKKTEDTSAEGGMRQLVSREHVFCQVCNAYHSFSRCWMRTAFIQTCTCCGMTFENPAKLYERHQPSCPQCGEYLEYPGFEYGLCDNCGSKYELVEGAKAGLLPNRKQREEMNKHGKSWSPD